MRPIICAILLFILLGFLHADIFIMKSDQVAEGTIIQETEKLFIIRKTDKKTGSIRKDNIAYQIPDMPIQKMLTKAKSYMNKNDFSTAYYFYLAAESKKPKNSEILTGIVNCLIKRKEYDKAYTKVKFALLWGKNPSLLLLLSEIYTFREEFDKADKLLLKLKKSKPELREIVDKYLSANQKARKIATDKKKDQKSNDFNSKFGNCKDAADNALLLLNWSKELDSRTFIGAELNLVVSGRKASSFTDIQTLRKYVYRVEFKMIVDKDRFVGTNPILSEKDRKITVLGWYFFLRNTYEKASKIDLEIHYEFLNRKNVVKSNILAKAYWGSKGDKIVIQYIRN